MDLGLKGKVAMIGGASRGLGLAVARALAAEGVTLSLASRKAAAVGAASQQVRGAFGVEVLPIAADLSRSDAIDAWFDETIKAFGGVDLLFVNTGGPPPGPTLAFDDEQWRAAFDLLVLSAVRMVRLAVPSMRGRGGGAILFSTSSSVKEPIQGLALSNVLRASVTSMAKTLSTELAADGIRVNCLVPGRIDTDRVRELDEARSRQAGISPEEQRTRTAASIPLGRYGDPDEFGRAAAFLLSDASRYTTGASLLVDGGLVRAVV